jgi:hypothetical protein
MAASGRLSNCSRSGSVHTCGANGIKIRMFAIAVRDLWSTKSAHFSSEILAVVLNEWSPD